MDKLTYVAPAGTSISSLMFGAKLERENGPSSPERYTSVFENLSVGSVRFSYNAEIGEYAVDEKKISTFDAISYAAGEGIPVILCIDTDYLLLKDTDHNPLTPRGVNLSYIEGIEGFIKNTLTKGVSRDLFGAQPTIAAIEIGNEYWGLGKMTSKEYGNLVNTLARVLHDVIEELGGDASSSPEILVQMGSPYSIEFDLQGSDPLYSGLSWAEALTRANLDIIGQITDLRAKEAIDGLVEHYYYTQPGDNFKFDSQSLRFIDYDWDLWSANGFADRDLYITEWNNKLSNPSQFGLKGAGVILEMFENMVKIGVDAANVWPFQHNETRLIDTLEPDQNGDPRITPRGAVFKLMAESLPGMRLMESNLNTAAGLPYELNAYTDGTDYVIFIASRIGRGQELNLDLSNHTGATSSVLGTKVGIDYFSADGHYLEGAVDRQVPLYQDPDALAKITDLGNIGFANSIELNLGAYEVLRLTYSLPKDLRQSGTERADSLIGGDGNDTIAGKGGGDIIQGSDGFDSLSGGSGRDAINSGQGNDVVSGGSGADQLNGDVGNDFLEGGLGADSISGGIGADTVDGAHGTDWISGGDGTDVIFGRQGGDTLFGGRGDDFVDGGGGTDTMNGGDGNDRIVMDNRSDRVIGSNGVDQVLSGTVSIDLSSETFASVENGRLLGSITLDLFGNRGSNNLQGNEGRNRIFGRDGNDTIEGSSGRDTLIGGGGDDTFVFRSTLSESNVDRIVDFNARDDSMRLDDAVFQNIPTGILSAAAFTKNSAGVATDESDRVIYELDTGRLYFDSDGTGSAERQHFATLSAEIRLTAADFFVI